MRYYEDDTRNRAVQNYLRSLRRRVTAPPKSVVLPAVGGPFDGGELCLSGGPNWDDVKTAVIRVGNQVGRYVHAWDTTGRAPRVFVWRVES